MARLIRRLLPFAIILVLLFVGCASFGDGHDDSEDFTEKVVYEDDFETSKGSGWKGRDAETVKVVDGVSMSGTKSLYITNRTKTWNGPMKDFSKVMKPGNTYLISFWAMFDEGPQSQSLQVSVQYNVPGKGETYENLGADKMVQGDWTYFELEFSLPESRYESAVSLYMETPWKADDVVTPEDTISFYIDDFVITRLPPAPPAMTETDIPTLHEYLPDFEIGAAVNRIYLDPKDPHHGLLRHFNVYVYENEMKQDAMQPTEGKFVFDRSDALIEYAAKEGKKVRGHVLVWHSQVPNWFFTGSGANGMATKEELYDRMETHIKTIVSRYKGKVDSWDVVNEALEEDGSLRNSKYYQIVGSHEYIAKAFQWAHEADPDAKLFINDYNVEVKNAKQDGYLKLVTDLLAEGVPITGVGFQAHINMSWPSVSEIRNSIHRFSDLGIMTQVTELDMSIYSDGNESKKNADKEILLEQAYKYRALMEMFGEEARAGRIDMVVLWGLSDDQTWLDNHPVPGRTNYPLLFGKDLRAKYAYWAIVDPDRLPIQIKQIEATKTDKPVKSLNDEMWKFVSPKDIEDTKGNNYGSFKLIWTAENLYVLATIKDATKTASDEVSFFIEPKNQKLKAKSADAISLSVSRSDAIADDGNEYTILQAIPFPNEAKAESKIGFDIRVNDGGTFHSWNDTSNIQDEASTNYATVSLRVLPPITFAKPGTVQIDGRIDAIWNTVEPVPMLIETEGFTLPGSQFRTLWDDEYLYVLFEVVDTVLNADSALEHEQDSVEAFIDQNNGKTQSYEPDDAQYRVSFLNEVSFNGGDRELFQSRSRVYAGGYLVEMAVPLTAVTPYPGLLMGFDAQVNEADASGSRTGIRSWATDSNLGYTNPSYLGLIMLID